MKYFLPVLCFLLVSCTQWYPERRPETDEERQAVAHLEERLIKQVPRVLSGSDQDWDDVIKTAHIVAIDTLCKTRLYEHKDGVETGRFTELN